MHTSVLWNIYIHSLFTHRLRHHDANIHKSQDLTIVPVVDLRSAFFVYDSKYLSSCPNDKTRMSVHKMRWRKGISAKSKGVLRVRWYILLKSIHPNHIFQGLIPKYSILCCRTFGACQFANFIMFFVNGKSYCLSLAIQNRLVEIVSYV